MSTNRTVLVQLNSLDLGGTQLNAVDFASAVEPYGYKSILYGPLDTLPQTGSTMFDVAAAKGVQIHGYRRDRGVLSGRAQEMAVRANRMNADIVHVYGALGEPRTAFWGPCLLGRRPFIHTVYEMTVDPRCYQHTSLIVGTRYLADELSSRPGQTTLISPPVDCSSDAPNHILAETFREGLQKELRERPLVVIVSRLDEVMKARPVQFAIEAMERVADLGISLVIVGGGNAEARLRTLGQAANSRAGRCLVHFTGSLPDPRGAYAAADLILGMGSSAARALAFGAPLIVQGEGGRPELFSPATAEALFRRSFWSRDPDPSGVTSLSNLIRDLFKDPERRLGLGPFGRDFAMANFALPLMAERLASVYDRALGTRGTALWLSDLRYDFTELAASIARRMPARSLHSRNPD